MVDFSVDLDVLRAPSVSTCRGGLVELRVRSSEALTTTQGSRPSSERSSNTEGGERLVWVSLYLSIDGRLDSGDTVLLRRQVKLSGNDEKAFKLDFSTAGLAVAEGSYNLIARVEPVGAVADSNAVNNQSVALVNSRGSDPILIWTSCALNAVQSAGSNGKPGVPPTVGTRLMAMLSTAMLDTVAAFGDKLTPYRFDLKAPSGASREAALVGAAQRILALELPGESELIQAQLTKSLADPQRLKAEHPGGSGVRRGSGRSGAGLPRQRWLHQQDPLHPPTNGLAGYVWMPATSGPTAGVALGANWGSVTPWVISGTDAYRSDGLQCRPDVDINAYAKQLDEVRQVGGLANTAATTIQRTADQGEIAKFWAYDRSDTFRPYGQLLDIAMDVAASQTSSLETNAKLIASLSTAMADAVICAWKEKYTNVQPRPWDLITGSFSDSDGVASTVRDTEWQSSLSLINGVQSPPFPDFLAGHAVMGGAFASVMTHFFGDNVVFSAKSVETPGKQRSFDGVITPGSLGDLSTVSVKGNSFYEAGLEDAVSRVYGGVHIREACLDAFNVGLSVGAAVASGTLG